MNDQVYRILIQYGLDDAAAKTAANELDDLGKKTEQSGEKAHDAHIQHRAFHQVLHLIGREAGPEAAAALSTIWAIVGGGGIMAGVFAVRELFGALEEVNKKANEAFAAMSQATDAVVESQRQALSKVREMAGEYKTVIQETKSEITAVTVEISKQEAILAAVNEMRKKALGDDKHALASEAKRAEKSELEQKAAELSDFQIQAQKANDEYQKAIARSKQFAASPIKNAEIADSIDLEEAKKTASQIRSFLKTARETYQQNPDAFIGPSAVPGETDKLSGFPTAMSARDAVTFATGKLRDAEKTIENLTASTTHRTGAQQKLDDAVKTAEQNFKDAQKKEDDARQKYDTARAVFETKNGNITAPAGVSSTGEEIHRRAERFARFDFDQLFQEHINPNDSNPRHNEMIAQILSAAQGHLVRVDKINDGLAQVFRSQDAINRSYDRLFQTIQSQIKQTANRPGS